MRLPQQIPYRVALELELTADPLEAQRALDRGLINQVVGTGEALDAAQAMAQRITANGPLAVAVSKQIVSQSRNWSADEMFAIQQELAMPVFTSEDATEGAAAFAEKRAPNWKGK